MSNRSTDTPRIGPYQLSGRVLLAPMAGITDEPFRRLCRHFGAAVAASEMTTADVSLWNTPKSRRRLSFGNDPTPRVVQLAGSDPGQLAGAARRVVDMGADIIDINMGCPAKKVCRRLAGSALLEDETLVRRILDAVVGAVDVPVTLKMRTGPSPQHRNGARIARIAQDAGIQALAVHGRTRACAYKGEVEYATIKAIKESVTIPVFANGDITSAAKAIDVLQRTRADGVMIGRAACGQPWLLTQIDYALREEKKSFAVPEISEQRDIVLAHLESMHRFYGEYTGVRVARKHLVWYATHMECGSQFRQRAVRAESTKAQMRITQEYFARRISGDRAATALGLPWKWCDGENNEPQKEKRRGTGNFGQQQKASAA